MPVHSHNDYWRATPLFDALSTGCTGVEADIWFDDLTPNSSELLVSHARKAVTPDRTLRSLYIDPLLSILNAQNAGLQPTAPRVGVYDTDPSATLVLMLDFKENGTDLWPLVQHHLTPLRQAGYLQYWNGTSLIPGPITIVGSGNAPFDLIRADAAHRDIFFDAPLDKLAGDAKYNHSNSYYASVAMGKSIGTLWGGRLSSAQRSKVQSQIDVACERGLLARYWSTPAWPISLRSRVWRELVDMGAGMLNADDLVSASRWDWGFCTVFGLPLCVTI